MDNKFDIRDLPLAGTAARLQRLEIDGIPERSETIETRPTGDEIIYFKEGTRFAICRTHVVALRDYVFGREKQRIKVVAMGPRERMYGLVPVECEMCKAVYVEGNRCNNADCDTPLHPQWPAVYCSSDCALDDR